MAEFIRLENSWINVDKIIRVESVGPDEADGIQLVVHYFADKKLALRGQDADRLRAYLISSSPRGK